MLSNVDIEKALLSGGLVISPPREGAVQPASYDLTLGDTERDRRVIKPGEFMLASTEEYVEIPDWLAAKVEGRSSTARRGLFIHVTAGWIDPGFHGNITLELYNVSGAIIPLPRGMGIAQLCFFRLDTPTTIPYGHPALGSHYQGSTGVVQARV